MIDLSHPVEHGVGTYPGHPVPVMGHHITFEQSRTAVAEGLEFAIDLITMVGGSATYIDAPRHVSSSGGDVASLPIDGLVRRRVVVVPAPEQGRRQYRPADFDGLDVGGAAVLLHTGWDEHWGTAAYSTGAPYLGGAAAKMLVDGGAALVGIDAVLIDDVDEPDPRPTLDAHVTLLGAGVPILENLRGLDQVPPSGAVLTAVPAAVRGVGSFPVRAFVEVG